MPVSERYRPATAHTALGPEFYDPVAAADFPEHHLRWRDDRAAAEIGLDTLDDAEWIEHFGRFAPLPDNLPEPLALRYHGHQFRSYNPDLGDGRGFLFAQAYDLTGRLMDLGTKGSGTTPWSRGGDGRLTLKGGVRELLATKMLELRGVPTSRTFSLVETGEALQRGDEPSPTRSAVLVRLSHGHIRIGSFQRFAALEEEANVLRLLDHTIRHYRPDAWREDEGERALAFLAGVVGDVARLGTRYMAAGFVHGVLNTDNINVTGESFDYGPWRFLPTLDPRFTAAYFDQTGLYAFGRQPDALLWNCTRLAECLLPFADKEALEDVLRRFEPAFHGAMAEAVVERLGLVPQGTDPDAALTEALWTAMARAQVPFEPTFWDWQGGLARRAEAEAGPSGEAYRSEAFAPFLEALAGYRSAERDRPDAPIDMLIERVEALWAPIAERDDWAPLREAVAEIEAASGAAAVPGLVEEEV